MVNCGPECSIIFVSVSRSLTTTFAILSTVIVGSQIINHIAHFTNPFFQKKLIGNLIQIDLDSDFIFGTFLLSQFYDWVITFPRD